MGMWITVGMRDPIGAVYRGTIRIFLPFSPEHSVWALRRNPTSSLAFRPTLRFFCFGVYDLEKWRGSHGM